VQTIFILLAVTGATLVGDYLIKLASDREAHPRSLTFVLGMILYGLPGIGWFYLMKSHSLAAVAVFYSASTIMMMAALGALVFREAFGLREAVGISLAVTSVAVMTWRT
jgi:undecaprenyl phosphate-alpha-L-ara4N flippase subunit ArnF